MNTSVHYIEQALTLGQQELACLLEGEVEQAAELAEKRAQLTAQAWSCRMEEDTAPLRDSMARLMTLQDTLTGEASRLREEIRAGLLKSRKEGQRLAGYRKVVEYAL